ncbi:hypothetical protein BS50DRAFT_640261 [Corynespora cassiicola Philippines]|uniref:Uncharacterized protein n=1 Tax=Corynespora cassiicola Philippines TaxID=1448308 RepID=A0A2T2N4K5_CORCC|nr:hypothetical protein BS50DRAFT_640261 [Corynespora cassiicola Philippines]
MDPVSTAITIVESVVRLVQVSSTITGTFREIKKSKSGFSRELEGFRSCAKLVEKKTDLIINAKNNALYDDDLENLAKELKEKTEEYIKELEELMWWKSDELKEGAETINKSAEQLTNYIFGTYLPNIDASLKDLHNQGSLMGTVISTGLTMVMEKVEEINQRSGGYHEVLDTMKN